MPSDEGKVRRVVLEDLLDRVNRMGVGDGTLEVTPEWVRREMDQHHQAKDQAAPATGGSAVPRGQCATAEDFVE